MGPPEHKQPDLGYDRTRMAADRTLMAWIRTSVSMISFGFTIYKFFIYLQESGFVSGQLPMYGPRNFGLGLVGLGTFLLALAILEHFTYQRSFAISVFPKYSMSVRYVFCEKTFYELVNSVKLRLNPH